MENTRAVLMDELRQEIGKEVGGGADIYEVKQELFNYLSNELDATAMDTQLEDIIHICNRLNNK